MVDRALSDLLLRDAQGEARQLPQRWRRRGGRFVLSALSCNASVSAILASDDRLGVADSAALVRRREGFDGASGGSRVRMADADDRLPADLAGALTGSGPVIARDAVWQSGPSDADASSADREP